MGPWQRTELVELGAHATAQGRGRVRWHDPVAFAGQVQHWTLDPGQVDRAAADLHRAADQAVLVEDLSDERAEDLSARETFELLSAREIKEADQIVDILSPLADDTAAQARQNAKQKRQADQTALNSLRKESTLQTINPAAVSIPVLPDRTPSPGKIRGRLSDGLLKFTAKPPLIT